MADDSERVREIIREELAARSDIVGLQTVYQRTQSLIRGAAWCAVQEIAGTAHAQQPSVADGSTSRPGSSRPGTQTVLPGHSYAQGITAPAEQPCATGTSSARPSMQTVTWPQDQEDDGDYAIEDDIILLKGIDAVAVEQPSQCYPPLPALNEHSADIAREAVCENLENALTFLKSKLGNLKEWLQISPEYALEETLAFYKSYDFQSNVKLAVQYKGQAAVDTGPNLRKWPVHNAGTVISGVREVVGKIFAHNIIQVGIGPACLAPAVYKYFVTEDLTESLTCLSVEDALNPVLHNYLELIVAPGADEALLETKRAEDEFQQLVFESGVTQLLMEYISSSESEDCTDEEFSTKKSFPRIFHLDGWSPSTHSRIHAIIRKYDLAEREPIVNDHDYCDLPNFICLSEFKSSAISYMAGYAAKMAEKRLYCHKCSRALGSTQAVTTSNFLNFKDRGGLFKPSPSVIKVCEETEKCFERMLKSAGGNLPRCMGIPDAIATAVLQGLDMSQIFPDLDTHMLECTVEDNHTFGLVKTVTKCYCTIRLHHLAKEQTAKQSGTKVRKKLSKLILFKHQ
eukprot:gene4096-4651_t